MTPSLVPHIACAVVALVAAGIFAGVPVLRWNLNHDAFMKALVGLFEKGDLERAHRLTRAVPHALAVFVGQPAVERATRQPPPSLDELAGLTAQQLHLAARVLRLWTFAGLAGLGLLVLTVVVGLVVQAPLSSPSWFICAMAGAALAVGTRAMATVQDAVQRMPVELLVPLLVALEQPQPTPEQVVAAVEAQAGLSQVR